MKTPTKTFGLNRAISFFISLIVLLTIFFVSFYYYYIPSNKDHLNKYAFLILSSIKGSIEDRNENLKRVSVVNIPALNNTPKNAIKCELTDVDEKKFTYSIENTKDSLKYIRYAEHNLSSFFQVHRNELFDAFLLMKNCDSDLVALCKDGMIDAGSKIKTDSLLKDVKGLFIPGTTTVNIEGIDYRMFYLPFVADKQSMVVCGFLKESSYKAKAHEIPAGFIYTFVIIFIALLVALPVLKFFFMSKGEEVKFSDLFLFVFSLLTGSTLITLIIIQFMILRSGELRAQANMAVLSGGIQTAFLKELGNAYMQLCRLDSILVHDPKVIDSTKNIDTKKNDTTHKKVTINVNIKDTAQFISFDRVAWSDSEGQQILKAEYAGDTLYPKINSRKYFLAFKNNEPYSVPYHTDSVFGIEPLYNWVNGIFRTVISKRSSYKNMYLVSLSCDLRSVTQTVLPAGYKFCIIDAKGDVQYHSDSARNLHENFIEYLETPGMVREAIASKQKMSSDNEGLYGKVHCLNIAPIKGLPFYLIIFYDKSEIVSTNMRILTFALILCFVSFIIYLSLWYFIVWKPNNGLYLLQNPVTASNWIIPKPGMTNIYRSFIICLSTYLVILVALTIRLKTQDLSNNYVMLLLMLFTPINITTAVIIILKKNFKRKETANTRSPIKKMLLFLAIPLTCIVALFFSFGIALYYFILFEAALIGLLLIYYHWFPLTRNESNENNERLYLNYYSFISLLTIIILAVLPACIFTWYSHNQELLQIVKKQQLFITDKIAERKSLLQKTLFQNSNYNSNEYYMQTCYKQGIYTYYNDSISLSPTPVKDSTNKNFDDFYFSISNVVSNNFYEKDIFPALKNQAADSSWIWYVYPRDSVLLFYNLLPASNNINDATNKYLRIRSMQPARYLFLTYNVRGAGLIIITLLVLAGIYFTIKAMAATVFLRKYTAVYKDENQSNFYLLVEKYLNSTFVATNTKQQLLALANNYNTTLKHKHLLSIGEKEKEIINETLTCKGFYEFIWKRCEEKEKHLLYNFCKDGMLNYKNTASVHCLFKKGLLIVNKYQEVAIFSPSFRLYILQYLPEADVAELKEKINKYNTWHSFRIPLLVTLAAIACFLFFTQEQTWQRIVAFITGFGSSLPLLLNIFSRAVSSAKK